MYGPKLRPSRDVIERAKELAEIFRKSEHNSTSPVSVGAGALYAASEEKGAGYTQRKIAEHFGLAEYTVREDSIKIRKSLSRSGLRSPP
jgi:transcription initiation factor TFIIIB Brf1 subunit/transcription initiation factor TFIIB